MTVTRYRLGYQIGNRAVRTVCCDEVIEGENLDRLKAEAQAAGLNRIEIEGQGRYRGALEAYDLGPGRRWEWLFAAF